MYIGTTSSTGLHHLIWEVFDNSRDEAMGGFANDIEIALLPDGSVRVVDNGRGIPVDIHSKTKVSALETVMTTLHAGGKFGGDGYKVSGGLHGVGVSVVNALSEAVRAEVHRDGGKHVQEYKDGGKAVGKVKKVGASKEHGTVILPIDSEHAALFQALQGVPREQVARLIVTGSGGALWRASREQMQTASREAVLNHPKWRMGPKITVDSATLMNKGLEVIEAHWLFGVPLDRLAVLIHPQAAIHAMVEMTDGSCLAQMSICDMRLPIQAALSYPERWPIDLPRLDFTGLSGLEFHEPDLDRFPCLRLALEAARQGGSACGVLSAANDEAVHAFLQGELAFPQIPEVISRTLRLHRVVAHPTIEQILSADVWARQTAREAIKTLHPHADVLIEPIEAPVVTSPV